MTHRDPLTNARIRFALATSALVLTAAGVVWQTGSADAPAGPRTGLSPNAAANPRDDSIRAAGAAAIAPASLRIGGWTRHAPIVIDNSGSAAQLANDQVRVELEFDGDMQADFDDIRFADSSGQLLDHWLESKTDSRSATFWVEVDEVPAMASAVVYVYYGNDSAASASDGDATFLLFDDFAGVTQRVLTRHSAQTLLEEAGNSDWLGRATLAEHGGTWILAYRQAVAHRYDEDAELHVRFSKDEGATWSAPDRLADGTSVRGAPFRSRDGNSPGVALILKAPNGDLLLQDAQTNARNQVGGTYQYRSSDGGASWTDEGQINNDAELLGGQDYTTVASDLYAVFWKDAHADGQPYQTLLYKSSDNGATWSFVSAVTSTADNTDEAGIAWAGGDTLIAVMRDSAGRTTYQRTSTDLGRTWGELQDIGMHVGILQRPRLRVFPEEPRRLYLYGRDHVEKHRRTVVYFSDNGGATWSERFLPELQGYKDAGYCDLLRRRDGSFYMISYAGTHYRAVLREYLFGFGDALRPDPEKWDRLAVFATVEDSRVLFEELNRQYGSRRGMLRARRAVQRPFVVDVDYIVESNDHVHFFYGPQVTPNNHAMQGYTWWIDINDPTHPRQDLLRSSGSTSTAIFLDARVSSDIANGEPFAQRFVFSESGITISTNGIEFITAREALHSQGRIAFGTGGGGVGSVGTLKVRKYAAREPIVTVGQERKLGPRGESR